MFVERVYDPPTIAVLHNDVSIVDIVAVVATVMEATSPPARFGLVVEPCVVAVVDLCDLAALYQGELASLLWFMIQKRSLRV